MTANEYDGQPGPPVRRFPTLKPFHAEPHAQDPKGVVRLALSESPYPPSPEAVDAAAAELARLNWYPHSDGEPLWEALAAHYGLPPEMVLVGNGLDELILLAAWATGLPGKHGLTTASTFADYAASLEIAGQRVVEIPFRDGVTDVDALKARMRGAGCVMVCNPHNPTASALAADEVAGLVRAARVAGTLLVLDEAYAEFTDPNPAVFGTGLQHLHGGSVIVLRTFSKAYGLAGLRAGYALGDPTVIGVMRAMRHTLPYNTNRLALAAATAALADQDHLRTVVAANRRARAAFAEVLRARGVETLPSETNFVLAQLGPDAPSVVARLVRDHAVSVRDATGLGFPGWARIGLPHENHVSAVADAIGQAFTATYDTTSEEES